MKFAVVALLPDTVPGRADFVARELEDEEAIASAIRELEEKAPRWRVLTICHVEDLPLLMEPGPGFGPVEPSS